MNLITISFELDYETQIALVKDIEALKGFWDSRGFTVSLFRDASRRTRFLQIFLTENTVDELTEIIQGESRVKAVFEKIRDAGSRITVSFLEQIL